MEGIKNSNRIDQLFDRGKDDILSIYFTAGYPGLNDTAPIIKYLQKSGVDMVEIGIPFSDPVADGETIQHSSQVALGNGMNLKLLLDQLRSIKSEIDIPIILMGYFNPIYQFGVEEFCKKCEEIGVDGLIIPDLPVYELETQYLNLFERHNLRNILLITPQTPESRIYQIDKLSTGFNYIVSSASTTGKTNEVNREQEEYLKRIQTLKLSNPMIVGFGINDQGSFNTVCKYARGAIIGSAFIKELAKKEPLESTVVAFIKSIKG